jgi:peptidoglycan/LPS O-acetylase OafA/YrhL
MPNDQREVSTLELKTITARNVPIDVLRGLSAVVVLMLHSVYFKLDPIPDFVIADPLFTLLKRNGYLGVTVFFVISGFLITSLCIKRYASSSGHININIANFYVLRASKIYPPLILLTLFNFALYAAGKSAFQIAPFSVGQILWYLYTFRYNVFFLNGAYPLLPWAPLWSLAIEEVFYLVYPWLLRCIKSRKVLLALLGLVVVAGTYFRLTFNRPETMYSYSTCIDSIAIGCMTAILCSFVPSVEKKYRTMLLAAGALVMACTYLSHDINDDVAVKWMPQVISLGAAIYLFGANYWVSSSRGVAWMPISIIGVLSYELYIFHMPLAFATEHVRRSYLSKLPFDLNVLACIVIFALVAGCIYWLFSLPVQKFIRRNGPRWMHGASQSLGHRA